MQIFRKTLFLPPPPDFFVFLPFRITGEKFSRGGGGGSEVGIGMQIVGGNFFPVVLFLKKVWVSFPGWLGKNRKWRGGGGEAVA